MGRKIGCKSTKSGELATMAAQYNKKQQWKLHAPGSIKTVLISL